MAVKLAMVPTNAATVTFQPGILQRPFGRGCTAGELWKRRGKTEDIGVTWTTVQKQAEYVPSHARLTTSKGCSLWYVIRPR